MKQTANGSHQNHTSPLPYHQNHHGQHTVTHPMYHPYSNAYHPSFHPHSVRDTAHKQLNHHNYNYNKEWQREREKVNVYGKSQWINDHKTENTNTECVAMDIESEESHNLKNIKRNKHRKHWILQSGYKLHGTLNKTKYRILKCIGKGRFSHVFSAYDESKGHNVAIKVDTNPKEKDLLQLEYEIMSTFRNSSPYICKVYDFGKLPKEIGIGNYLCMELCNEQNLSDKRKECPSKCFGIQKGALIGVEIILSLKEFHDCGYVHRDVKPSNFVLPLTTYWQNHVYIVDFGLSKKFNYKTCKTQGEAEFIGTSLYASITAHNKLDLSPIDDLWSAAFVIIDISTNALPWKPLYIKLENQSKLRRTEVGKLKNTFIESILNDTQSFKYKLPKEYKHFIRILHETKYNETPRYYELIHTLRMIASNHKYAEDQYVADHAPLMIDRPIHTNFEILNQALCIDNICVNNYLCKEFIERNNDCSSGRPPGSWCNNGYHWTLNDEMHFRNTKELPTVHIITNDICNEAMEYMDICNANNNCNKRHPKNGIKYIWNQTKTFSKKKAFWGQCDVDNFINLGLSPKGINYDRQIINSNNFKMYLNPYIMYKYEMVIHNTIFKENDFADNAVIDALFKLNVSQSMTVLKDLLNKYHVSSITNDLLIDNETKRREYILHLLNMAFSQIKCPNLCKRREEKQISITYPALYQKTLDGKFTLNVNTNDCHKDNDENAQKAVLQRLEEFVRHARGKNIGNEIIDILMNIPSKYAIDVLNEIQNMGLHKISVVQSAIKRACHKYILQTNPNINTNPIANTNKPSPNHKIISITKPKSKISIGNLGYLDHVITDIKQSPKQCNVQQRNKFNYSRVRSSLRYNSNPSSSSSFKMLIPKKTHLIPTNRSVVKNIAKKIIKKEKKIKKKKSKKKKNKKKLKKKQIIKRINKTLDCDDDDDDDDIVNVLHRNHKRKNRAINDSSDDNMDCDDEQTSDSDDDIPIGQRKRKRKCIDDYELYELYAPQRSKRKRNENISYREDDLYNEYVSHSMEESFFSQSNNMKKEFEEIFADNNTYLASNQVKMSYAQMSSKQFKAMKKENILTAKKEIARDTACYLVSKYNTPIDTSLITPSGVTCFKCQSDPSDMEWELLLCEYCPIGAAHCSCLDPIYPSVPEGSWACIECQNKVIEQHCDEYNNIVKVKHAKLQDKYRSNQISFKKRIEIQPRSFTNNMSSIGNFFPINSIPQLRMLNPMDSRMMNPYEPPPQMFNQFLHALNQKGHAPIAPNTININRVNVTNINCSNFTIPSNQQSNNQYANGQQ